MKPTPENTTTQTFTIPRSTLLLHTSFIALAAVSLFLAFTEADTAYTGYIWKYSTQYIYKTTLYAITMFIAAVFLTQSSMLLIKNRPNASIPGFFGCIILVVFPAYLLVVDPEHAVPLAILIIPAILLILFCVMMLWKKRRSDTPPQPHQHQDHKPNKRQP